MITVELLGIEAVLSKVIQVSSPAVQTAVLMDGAEFIRGKLQRYPQYQYISRRRAYGKPFFTDLQRRWFFWALSVGALVVPYPRTMELKRAWKIVRASQSDILLTNNRENNRFVIGETTQSRMMVMRGWQPPIQVIKDNEGQLVRELDASMSRNLRRYV